jgi:hypothetical protein
MGRNAARHFQKEINEIVHDNVPLCFLPLWKKITIKMQKLIKKHFKKQNLLVRWDKKPVLTSEPTEYTRNAFMVEYFTQPAEHEIENLHLTAATQKCGCDGAGGWLPRRFPNFPRTRSWMTRVAAPHRSIGSQ